MTYHNDYFSWNIKKNFFRSNTVFTFYLLCQNISKPHCHMYVPVKFPVFPYLVLFMFSLVNLSNYHSVHLCLLIILFAP